MNGLVCTLYLHKAVLKRVPGEAEADRFQVKESGSEGGRGGAGLCPGTPTTSMTWALHLDKSCRPRSARSKSSRYSSSDFWLSSPEPVTTWGGSAVTLTVTFILYFSDSLKKHYKRAAIIQPPRQRNQGLDK